MSGRTEPPDRRSESFPAGVPARTPVSLDESVGQADNPRVGSGRPLIVTPDELEQELRDCLTRQASVARPATADRAGIALRHANRIHRRRTVAGVALTALATIVSAGLTQIAGAPGQRPGPSVVVFGDPPDAQVSKAVPATPPGSAETDPAAPPRVDLVVAHDLSTAGGDLIDLSEIGTVVQARQVPGGWLVVGASPTQRASLWFVTVNLKPKALLSDTDAVTLAQDGRRVAWRDGTQLHVASFNEGKLATGIEVSAPARGVPIGFVGMAVLMRRGNDTGNDAYDLWSPSRPPYRENWTTVPAGVYGVLPDGETLVGQVRAGTPPRPCLALLDTNRQFTPVRTECSLPLSAGGSGVVSPDGRWLVANGRSTSASDGADTATNSAAGSSDERALVVDLHKAFNDKAVPARPAGPRLTGEAVWTDVRTVVHADERGELVRVVTDRVVDGGEQDVEKFPAPGAGPGDRLVMVSGDHS